VCAPAVKDFATVRNRSVHTIEDAQPRSQTVMTCSEPRPRVARGALGMTSLPAGLVLLVVAVRLPATSLVLFLIGGALIGAGAGAV